MIMFRELDNRGSTDLSPNDSVPKLMAELHLTVRSRFRSAVLYPHADVSRE